MIDVDDEAWTPPYIPIRAMTGHGFCGLDDREETPRLKAFLVARAGTSHPRASSRRKARIRAK
ncbi:hypothetical protein [Aminomonas paucivorans]|uniref:hypothetical protein n=1 Tax=Aminomonas paucivorans TaxID=81412 RepID=UPI0012EAB502|nr:hypothetical protein [Aminomonas paucivorans]